MLSFRRLGLVLTLLSIPTLVPTFAGPTLEGRIVDEATGAPLAARLYIRAASGSWHHATSTSSNGMAVPYDVRRGAESIEVHTSLSAHPFVAELPPGAYSLVAERGKEYLPATAEVRITDDGVPATISLSLRRWTDMASRGWFSGETHVHRSLNELPTLLLAEDLNVALPLTSWVTDSRTAPSQANKNTEPGPPPRLIEVDPTHVIWPVNTEYEIFTVDGQSHTLGAVFVLNHREPLAMNAPPVTPIAEAARHQGALLDLDKHNWPWSMMLVPIMDIDLFELTNNHVWRTEFLFEDWYTEYVGEHMEVERRDGRFTERGWIDFGFQTCYTLLNCGFDLKPTAGTASGVHPVPLGFGRVYVQIDGDFGYDKWIEGLAAGRSFVTTGPMLTVEMRRERDEVRIDGLLESASPPGPIEIVMNGRQVQALKTQAARSASGAFRSQFRTRVPLEGTSWIAARAFEEREDGRPRFAHTAPVRFEVEGRPLRPAKAEVAYLIKRVADEIQRHQGVLGEAALREYRSALTHYEALLSTAR